MAKQTLHRLDPRTAMTIKTPGRHSDGGGLYLAIDKKGRRRWCFMYVRGGKRTELGLGGGRDIKLTDARDAAAEHRKTLKKGGDPRAAPEQPKTAIFGEYADAYIETHKAGWKNQKHIDQWTMTLTKYAAPLRKRLVHSITTEDILAVLTPIWNRTPETAERLRGRLEKVLDAAKVENLRSGDNPARWRGHLEHPLTKRRYLSRGHHAALPYAELPDFLAQLRTRVAGAGQALEFAILTATRTSEVLGAQWQEFELADEGSLWVIPKERMKAQREHRVPLSDQAVSLLRVRQAARDKKTAKPTDFVFCADDQPTKPLSIMAMSMLLRRMGYAAGVVTVHGFRSTFRDWASETTATPHDVCEMALAHSIGNKTEAAYRRGDLLQKRRELMVAWAEFCGPGSI